MKLNLLLILILALIVAGTNFLHFWQDYVIDDNYPENINIISFILGLAIAIFALINIFIN